MEILSGFRAAYDCGQMAKMARDWTDAEFEVIDGPPRIGDPHPRLRGWRYAGVDTYGRPLWRSPGWPRWKLALAMILGAPAALAGVYIAAQTLAHH